MSASPLEQGNLSIHSENIFPIIKKWLYSDHDIFVRELISNAADAITKLKHIEVVEGYQNAEGPYRIDVLLDKDAGTIAFSDNGIGMSDEEIRKYINQIAFSGAEEFLKAYQGKDEQSQIIGHFGLGFYSAFMVADKVEISTKSYKADAQAVQWSCDGSTTFAMGPGVKTTRGTEITLHINKEFAQFLEKETLTSTIDKYCGFLPVPVHFQGELLNEPEPLWTKMPATLKDEDYKSFYRKVFPGLPDPLFWIHLNVDYPFSLKGLLFFPKIDRELDPHKGKVKLFCNQVFVSDNCKELVPEFLTLLQGVVDSPNIPLNVSRSSLQREPIAQKISAHIIKKIADKLGGMYKTEREQYEAYWPDIHPLLKYGMMKEESFYDKMKEYVLFASSNGGYTTLDDYLKRNEEKHKNKVYYASSAQAQGKYLDLFKEHNLEALVLDSFIDTHFVQFLEYKNSLVTFARVDSDMSEHLVEKDETSPIIDPKDNKSLRDKLIGAFSTCLDKAGLSVDVKQLKTNEVPAIIVTPEYARRMQEMIASQGPSTGDAAFPQQHSLILNSAHPIIKNLERLCGNADVDTRVPEICKQVYDLARLSHDGLKDQALKDFIKRSEGILEQYARKSLIIT